MAKLHRAILPLVLVAVTACSGDDSGSGPAATAAGLAAQPGMSIPDAETEVDEASGVEAFEDEPDTSPDTTYGGELRPAAEVLEEEARDASRTGVIGEPVDLYHGLTVLVSSIELADQAPPGLTARPADVPTSDFAIDVSIRTENRSADYLTNPDVQVTCTNDVPPGTLYLGGSTFETYGDLPPRTFDDGVITLAVPFECVDPVVRVSDYVYSDDEWSEDDEVAIDWAVPADVHP